MSGSAGPPRSSPSTSATTTGRTGTWGAACVRRSGPSGTAASGPSPPRTWRSRCSTGPGAVGSSGDCPTTRSSGSWPRPTHPRPVRTPRRVPGPTSRPPVASSRRAAPRPPTTEAVVSRAPQAEPAAGHRTATGTHAVPETPVDLIFNPWLPEIHANPYPVYRRLQQEDSVHRPFPGVVILSRHRDVATLLRHPALSSDRRNSPVYEQFIAALPVEPDEGALTPSMLFLDPPDRSEEHTSELQSREKSVCRLLLEKKKKKLIKYMFGKKKIKKKNRSKRNIGT